jgi:hypothetical protein
MGDGRGHTHCSCAGRRPATATAATSLAQARPAIPGGATALHPIDQRQPTRNGPARPVHGQCCRESARMALSAADGGRSGVDSLRSTADNVSLASTRSGRRPTNVGPASTRSGRRPTNVSLRLTDLCRPSTEVSQKPDGLCRRPTTRDRRLSRVGGGRRGRSSAVTAPSLADRPGSPVVSPPRGPRARIGGRTRSVDGRIPRIEERTAPSAADDPRSPPAAALRQGCPCEARVQWPPGRPDLATAAEPAPGAGATVTAAA